MSVEDVASNPLLQMESMQKLMETQIQMLQLQLQQNNITAGTSINNPSNIGLGDEMAMPVSIVKNVKVPEGRYDMNSNEFRTFRKDCHHYKKLTQYSDEQVVLQIRMNMDSDLKRAVDVNFKDDWDTFSVEDAIKAIETLLKVKNTPVVHRKEFDGMVQQDSEGFKEFVTRLKACAADCNFLCPFNDSHNLTEYHVINRVRSGVSDQILQQELLQKSDALNTLPLITAYCENFESAKTDREKLATRNTVVSAVELHDLSEEEVIAAVSSYKRSKQQSSLGEKQDKKKNKCFNCGYDWPHLGGNESCPAKGKTCNKCKKKNHFEAVCKNISRSLRREVSTMVISGIHRISMMSEEEKGSLPRLKVFIGMDNNQPPIETVVVADTGAQVTVAGYKHMKHLGIKQQ